MDMAEAARRLGVADTEVVDIKAHAGWWHVLHHDMASHEETWRDVPVSVGDSPVPTAEDVPEPDSDAEGSPESGSGDQVPDGTIAEVIDWVGGDPDRAALALDAEQKRDQPRTTLVAALEKVAG